LPKYLVSILRKKFSDFKPVKSKRINEADENQMTQEMPMANLPENILDQEQQNNEQPSEGGDVIKFISKIFESRQMAHVYHLQVKGDMGSHAKHIALQEYYEGDDEGEGGILDSLDTLIEIYQAQYGLIEGYDIIDTKESNSKDPIEYFMDLGKFIKSERKNCFNEEDTEFLNIIDDILVLIYQTVYKLKFTK
jgi:hypothetical protein